MRSLLLSIAILPCQAWANTIAVTEWINNVAGDENNDEWFELYNYGTSPVSLAGWTIAEDGGTPVALPSVTIPSDGYVVVVADAAAFVALWGVGTTGTDVHEVNFGSLSNDADEIILSDAGGVVRWQVAWSNDEDSGAATFLQSNRFTITTWGNATAPGVVRDGYDLGGARVLGYESNARTTDVTAWTASSGDVGSPLTGFYSPPALEQTSRATVAITEIMHHSMNTGSDYDGDWVELHNYGGLAIDLAGFVLRDGFGAADSYVVPRGVTLPAHGYLIITADPAAFVATWGRGVAGSTVIGDSSVPGLGSADELELLDPTGAWVWSVGWDDQTPWSDWPTHYVLDRVLATDWGRIGWRDVVYGALDAQGTTGYENGGQARDNSRFTGGTDQASPLAGVWTAVAGLPRVTIQGACPGAATLDFRGFSPRATVTLARSTSVGAFGPSAGPCAGERSWLGTRGLSVVGNFTVDAQGNARVPVTLPAAACGSYIQALQGSSCTFSELGQVPW